MRQVHISQVDAMFANGRYPIEFLFYYEHSVPSKRLRNALRNLAQDFWPAFGEYADGIISFDRYLEEDCFDEEAVDAGLDVSDITSGVPEVISRFGLRDMRRLFFLKVIRFRNGTALITGLKHVAGDGYSYFTFLSVLAAIARRSIIPFRSHVLRSMLKPHHRRTALGKCSFEGGDLEPDPPHERLTIQTDEVPRREVQSLIKDAASSHGLRISSNDVLSAMMVKQLARIQPEGGEEYFRLTIPIDVRGKVEEYGRRFFGNGLMFHKVIFERERIEHSPLLEIAARIRRSMPAVSRESYLQYLEGLDRIISEKKWDRLRPFDPKSGCLVTNLSKLPVGRLDFGAGRPHTIVPLTVEENSAGVLATEDNYMLRYTRPEVTSLREGRSASQLRA